jgi:hypothetical protein
MAKKVQLEVEIKGNDSVAQASEKTKALRDNIQKLKETLATGGLGEKEYQKANDQLQKYEDKLKKSETATKSLKSQLRELQNDLQSGKLTGKEFDEGVRRAAAMKDQIIDVNNRVKALATDGPDVMLKGFGDMATGIVGGFAAAQGAMALFGSENEDLQKTLVKLQGATALLNGLQQVNATLQGDSAAMVSLNTAKTKILTAVQGRYTAVVGTTTGAMKLLRLAGAALGIGLIVTAIGLLIANFDKIKKVVLGFLPDLSVLGDLFTKVKNAVMDFVGISSEAERQEETAAKQRAVRSQQLKDEIELMEANGASARELYLAKRKLLFNDLETLKIAAFKKGATQDEIKAYNEMVQAIRVLDAEETTRIKEGATKANDEAAKKRKEAHDKRIEQEKKDAEELKKLIADETQKLREQQFSDQAKEISALQLAAEEKMKIAKGNAEAEKLIRENLSKDIATLNEKYAKEEAEKKKEADKKLTDLIEQRRVDDLSVREKELFDISEKYRKEQELALGNATLLAEIQTDKDNALREKKLQFDAEDAALQQEADNVRIEQIARTAEQAGQLINQLAGKNKAAALTALALEKGAAIANVVVSTQREIAAYRANPTWSLLPDGGAAIKATNIIAAKVRAGISIASISAAGLSGAKNITGGGGGGSVQPPNIRGSQTTNEPTSQPATKVFVTETDIRSVTRKVDGIFTQATIQ